MKKSTEYRVQSTEYWAAALLSTKYYVLRTGFSGGKT